MALLFCMSGFGWFPTVMGVCILISIIVDYWKNYTTLYPVYMRLSVTMFYGFIFFSLFLWFGWNNILLLILCVIIINTYMSVVRILEAKISETDKNRSTGGQERCESTGGHAHKVSDTL